MKTRIALAAGMLLTLGAAAVPSSAINALQPAQPIAQPRSLEALSAEVTPEMIAVWRTTAATRDYVASKRPI